MRKWFAVLAILALVTGCPRPTNSNGNANNNSAAGGGADTGQNTPGGTDGNTNSNANDNSSTGGSGGVLSGNSTGNIPLIDMKPGDTYLSFPGQLYDGSNDPPAAHLQAAMDRAAAATALDSTGAISSSGRIVLATFGFSNPRRESEAFLDELSTLQGLNPQLTVVNCCRPGEGTVEMSDPTTTYFQYAAQQLSDAGVTPAQVQFGWLKEVKAYPNGEEFVSYASSMRDQLKIIAARLRTEYPNLKTVYVTSRSYGGYSEDDGNPEPWAYETGFAMKWLVQAQIDGDPALNFDAARGTVVAPLLLWGPYIWADGINPRSDGLFYTRSDYSGDDGRHPTATGKMKVADMLVDFFSGSPSTRTWFLANP